MKTFGTDPEFIVVDQKGNPRSAIKLLEGDIYNRVNIKGHQFYSDNVLAECAVKPAKTKKEAVNHIGQCLKTFSKMLDPYQLSNSCADNFDDKELKCKCKGEHNLCAKHVGCDPDYCAYQMAMIQTPSSIMDKNLRTCGGHIHLGGSGESLDGGGEKTYKLIYMLDLLLAVPSLFMEYESGDLTGLHKQRREIYGQAGRYRPKDYGIEYRSLSNFWLRSPKLVSLVYEICMFAIDFVDSGQADKYFEFDFDKFCDTQGDGLESWNFKEFSRDELIHCINKSDRNEGCKFLSIAQRILSPKLSRNIESLIGCQFDIYKEWNLT